MKRIVGAYAKPAPIAYAIPCDTNKCVVVVENDPATSARHMMRKPTGLAYRLSFGLAMSKPNTPGEKMYIMP
jgi:hypothetical protein